MSIWDEIDALKREHDRLISWLQSDDYRGWSLQDATPDGCWAAMWRATTLRPRIYVKARTVDELQKLIVETMRLHKEKESKSGDGAGQ